jgi:hypothetical protein
MEMTHLGSAPMHKIIAGLFLIHSKEIPVDT